MKTDQPVGVSTPSQPPVLMPAAARTLLRIVTDAAARRLDSIDRQAA